MGVLERALGGPEIEVTATATRRQSALEYTRKIVRGADGGPVRRQWARASWIEPKRVGNTGRSVRVLNSASENGLSLETCRRACVLVTPSSASKRATGLDVTAGPRSGWMVLTPADVHHGGAEQRIAARATVLATAYAAHPERFPAGLPQPPARPADVWINRPQTRADRVLDQFLPADRDPEAARRIPR